MEKINKIYNVKKWLQEEVKTFLTVRKQSNGIVFFNDKQKIKIFIPYKIIEKQDYEWIYHNYFYNEYTDGFYHMEWKHY